MAGSQRWANLAVPSADARIEQIRAMKQTSAACAARSAAPSCSAKRRHSLSTAGDGASAARGLPTAPGCGTAASAAGCWAPFAAPAVPAPSRARFGGRSEPSAAVSEALAGCSACALASTYARVARVGMKQQSAQHSLCMPAPCSASAHLMPVVNCCEPNAANTSTSITAASMCWVQGCHECNAERHLAQRGAEGGDQGRPLAAHGQLCNAAQEVRIVAAPPCAGHLVAGSPDLRNRDRPPSHEELAAAHMLRQKLSGVTAVLLDVLVCEFQLTRSLKAGSSGASASRASTGRKPPSRSDESVCWLRFSTTKLAPACTTDDQALRSKRHITPATTAGPWLDGLRLGLIESNHCKTP